MSLNTEQKVDRASRGRFADIALQHSVDQLKAQEERAIHQLLIEFRTNLSTNKMLSYVAQIASIRELIETLQRQVKHGNLARKEVEDEYQRAVEANEI